MPIEKLPIPPVDLQPLTTKVDTLTSKVDTVDSVVDAIKVKTDGITALDSKIVTVDSIVDAIKAKTDLLTGIETKIDTIDSLVDAVKAKTDTYTNHGIKSWQRLMQETAYTDDRGRHMTFLLSPQVNPAKCLVTVNGFDSGYYHNTHIMRHISEFTADHITLSRHYGYAWSAYWRPAIYSIVIVEYY